jgi:hypothetical protein
MERATRKSQVTSAPRHSAEAYGLRGKRNLIWEVRSTGLNRSLSLSLIGGPKAHDDKEHLTYSRFESARTHQFLRAT